MKKVLLLTSLAVLTLAACGGRADRSKEHKHQRRHLTEEQRACVRRHECPRLKRADGTKDPAAKRCLRRAFEACGVENPDRMAHYGNRRDDRMAHNRMHNDRLAENMVIVPDYMLIRDYTLVPEFEYEYQVLYLMDDTDTNTNAAGA